MTRKNSARSLIREEEEQTLRLPFGIEVHLPFNHGLDNPNLIPETPETATEWYAGVVSREFPTASELEGLSYMRESCAVELEGSPEHLDVIGDLRMLRFLRGTKGDWNAASEVFREFLRWRVKYLVDEQIRNHVVNLSPKEFMKKLKKWPHSPYLPRCICAGRNMQGDIVTFEALGQCVPDMIMKSASEKELWEYEMMTEEWTMWYLDKLSRSERRMVHVLKVVDVKGLGPHHFDFRALRLVQRIVVDVLLAYRETTSAVVVVNTPWIFPQAYAMLSPLFTKRQRKKVRVLGNASDAAVQQTLLNLVPADILPKEYGGQGRSVSAVSHSCSLEQSMMVTSERNEEVEVHVPSHTVKWSLVLPDDEPDIEYDLVFESDRDHHQKVLGASRLSRKDGMVFESASVQGAGQASLRLRRYNSSWFNKGRNALVQYSLKLSDFKLESSPSGDLRSANEETTSATHIARQRLALRRSAARTAFFRIQLFSGIGAMVFGLLWWRQRHQ